MFLNEEMEVKSDMPRNTGDLLIAAHELRKRLLFKVVDQKDKLDWLQDRTLSSCMGTDENQASQYIPSYRST
jgi:hypothetical protein